MKAPKGMSELTGVKIEVLPAREGEPVWVLSEVEVKESRGKTGGSGSFRRGNGPKAEGQMSNKPLRLVNGSASYEEADYEVVRPTMVSEAITLLVGS